jgi:hypothetical protein
MSSSPREGAMSSAQQLLDTAGRRRSPATLSEFHAGRAPGNKGQRYAADPPTVDEIVAVMRRAAHARYGNRLNGLIVGAVACRAADQRGAVADRDRSGGTARIGFGQAWQERSPSPGRDGRVGMDGARTVAGRARRVAGRPVVLRDRRTHRRARLVSQRRQAPATPGRA